jgi:hypothetical protein
VSQPCPMSQPCPTSRFDAMLSPCNMRVIDWDMGVTGSREISPAAFWSAGLPAPVATKSPNSPVPASRLSMGPISCTNVWRHWPIPLRPRNVGCDIGPLMTGADDGAASGAGIRLAAAGAWGAPVPNRTVGLRAKPLRPAPCAKPPRAKLGADATIQVAANTAAKRRRMIMSLVL